MSVGGSSEVKGGFGNRFLRVLSKPGRMVWAEWDELRHGAAVIGRALYLCVRPRSWTRARRDIFSRQVLAIGVEAIGVVFWVAVLVGISVVVQLSFWVGAAGQSHLLGPLLVAVVARELGPLLINLIVIIRSGSAMTTELGALNINGEVRALEAEQNDPFLQLVMPRVCGMAVSIFCLIIIFVLVAFASGYVFAAWMGKGSGDLLLFVDTVTRAARPHDVFSILAKSILPALFASASCCIGGLGVGSVADMPPATQRALTRSVVGLFVISVTVSLLTYL